MVKLPYVIFTLSGLIFTGNIGSSPPLGLLDLRVAYVGGGHVITKPRKPHSLSAYAAGAVKDEARPVKAIIGKYFFQYHCLLTGGSSQSRNSLSYGDARLS